MKDHLVEINPENWPILKNIYSPGGKKSYITYTTIDNYIQWQQKDSQLKHVKFFCLNSDFSDGTFIVTVNILIVSRFFPTSSAILIHLM